MIIAQHGDECVMSGGRGFISFPDVFVRLRVFVTFSVGVEDTESFGGFPDTPRTSGQMAGR
jgi:hypothetical protein